MVFKCIYCGKECATYQSKNAHLGHCSKRLLFRYVKLSSEGKHYLFIIKLNPSRPIYKALDSVIKDFDDVKILIGILIFLKKKKDINVFNVVEITSPTMIEYRNGWVGVTKLERMLNPADKQTILGVKTE